MKSLFISILILSFHSATAQHTVRGRVLDERTREPLAFVNIKINESPRLGVTTDINGNFSFRSDASIQTLTLSYVGYERKIVNLDTVKNPTQMIIRLRQTDIVLQTVTIEAGENPAHRIIRQVTENRRINNPENVTSFRYNSHNKIIYDIIVTDTTPRGDTMQARMNRTLQGGHLLMMETVTERIFRYPNRNQETILGTKISGFQEFTLPFSATDFQPFSFYGDHFHLLDVAYLSPISRGSTNHYFFNIEDTVYHNQDTVFVISFRPQQGRNFNGLKGVLQINTNRYAVQNVIAEPAEQGLINMKIQQKYVFLNDTQWFPSQLNFEISLNNPPQTQRMVMKGYGYIEDVELFPTLRRRDFSIDEVLVDIMANLQDSLFWEQRRIISLDSAEIRTYQFWDSIGEVLNLDRFMTFFDKLIQGKIQIKCFDLDFSNTLVMNEFEGMRLGFGLMTNERISKHFSIGGFFGYGLRDKLWKYGGEGILNISRKHEIDLRLSYQNTVRETGRTALYTGHNSLTDFRSFLASQMDQIEQMSVNFGFRALRFAKFNVALNHTFVKPLYDDYAFQSDAFGSLTNYRYTSLNIGLRYAFGERLMRTSTQRMSLGTRFPIIHLNYIRGINGFLNGNLEFNKFEFRADYSHTWKILGESKFRIDAGMADRSLPYGLLYTGEGSVNKNWGIFVPNYFQTIKNYEFLSDQYANVFLSHNFGSLFLRLGRFQPHFTVHHNMGWGRLSNPEHQQNIAFAVKDKGFFESGLQIDRILRLRYLNMFYIGFGAGAYYRYGDHAFERTKDNFAFKFSFTFFTK